MSCILLFLTIFYVVKSILSYISIALPYFFWLAFEWCIFILLLWPWLLAHHWDKILDTYNLNEGGLFGSWFQIRENWFQSRNGIVKEQGVRSVFNPWQPRNRERKEEPGTRIHPYKSHPQGPIPCNFPS